MSPAAIFQPLDGLGETLEIVLHLPSAAPRSDDHLQADQDEGPDHPGPDERRSF